MKLRFWRSFCLQILQEYRWNRGHQDDRSRSWATSRWTRNCAYSNLSRDL